MVDGTGVSVDGTGVSVDSNMVSVGTRGVLVAGAGVFNAATTMCVLVGALCPFSQVAPLSWLASQVIVADGLG